MTEPATENSPTELGAMIDELIELRDARQQIAAQDRQLKTRFDELELIVMATLEASGLRTSGSALGAAAITKETVAQIKDFDDFADYLVANNAVHLLQRRVNNAAYRELLAAGVEIPGVEPFVITKLSLRSAR